MGDSPTPPAVPDPTQTAQAQYAANTQSGIANSILGNPNVSNPYGSVTYTPGASTNIGGFDIPRYDENVTLSPGQQKLYNQQTALGRQENSIAKTALGNVSSVLGQPISGLPSISTSGGDPNTVLQRGAQAGPLQTSIADAGNIGRSIAGAGNIQRSFGPTDFTQNINDTTAAIQSRLAPQLALQKQHLQSQLANQGVTPGSQAYETAMDEFGRQSNDANTQALLAGNQEQSVLFGQAQAQGNFANSAQGQQFSQNAAQLAAQNAGQQQQFDQNAARGTFANAAQGQFFGEDLQNIQQTNANNAQLFNQRQSAQASQNAAALQATQQAMALREAPINEIAALSKGGQVTAPQFGAYQPGQVAAAPVAQSAYNSAGLLNQQYTTQLQAQGAQNAGLFGLGGAVAGAAGNYFGSRPSDRRLKRDIVRTGKIGRFNAYAFRYLWSDQVHIGVMADEVLPIAPEAVAVNDDGFLSVDYSKLAA